MAVALKAQSAEFRLIFCKTSMASILTIPFLPSLFSMPWGSPSPFFSVSFTFLFPKLPTVGTAGSLQSGSFSVGSFVSYSSPSIPPPSQATADFIWSWWVNMSWWTFLYCITPCRLHPAGIPLYAHRRLSLWETNAFFLNEKSDLEVEERAKPSSFKAVSLLWLSWVMGSPHRAHVLSVLILIC